MPESQHDATPLAKPQVSQAVGKFNHTGVGVFRRNDKMAPTVYNRVDKVEMKVKRAAAYSIITTREAEEHITASNVKGE